jgi:hypothetical protein
LRRFHPNFGERADGKHPIFMRRLSLLQEIGKATSFPARSRAN